MTLGENIAKLRGELHLSQGDLAERVGVSRQSVSKWETGSSIPDLDKLVALSELFEVSLDALVKAPEENVPKENAQPGATPPTTEQYPTRKIVGWILLGVGLLCLVLGIVLNLLLVILGGYLLFCGLICQSVKKHPGLAIGWVTFLPCAYFLPRVTGANMRMIFVPYVYQAGFEMGLVISYAFWALLICLLWLTIRNTRANRHPVLLCGWALFPPVSDFIPIAFRATEETGAIYIAISWCVILFLAALLFFTGKSLRAYLQTAKMKH